MKHTSMTSLTVFVYFDGYIAIFFFFGTISLLYMTGVAQLPPKVFFLVLQMAGNGSKQVEPVFALE